MSWKRTVVSAMVAAGACVGSQAHELADLSGAQLYQHLCASCHGPAGQGDGPVAATLKVQVPDLTRIAARHRGSFPKERVRQSIDGQLLTAAHGTRAMPVWGRELYAFKGEDAARRQRVADLLSSLVDYLVSIQRK